MTSYRLLKALYKLLFTSFTLLFISCSIPNIPDFTDKPDKPAVVKPDTPQNNFTDDLTPLLQWVGYAAIFVLIGSAAAAIALKMTGLFHISGLAGIVALCCMLLVYALNYIWIIVAVIFWALLFWGAYKIWLMHGEKKERDHIINELGREFHNPSGEKMLTREAEKALRKHSADKSDVLAAHKKYSKRLKSKKI